MNKNKPELLSPAGNWSSLIGSVESGADSVYFGIKGITMRQFAGNFDVLELGKVMRFLHEHHCKGYLALNTIMMTSELSKVKAILREAKNVKVDAVILWDMAVFSYAKELGLPIHLSTQASVANIDAVKFFAAQGVKRVVMARECTLSDLREIANIIRKEKIDCELEVFIHGAMCLSISGRCFMGYYTHGKSANRGECTQPCRREFSVVDKDGEVEFVVGKDYVLSPKDLCTIDFIDALIDAGIASFKIEGRMRPSEYSKIVTAVYRGCIDAYFDGTLDMGLKKKSRQRLSAVYNRGFSNGFYFGKPDNEQGASIAHTHVKVFLGEVTRFFRKIQVAEIRLRSAGLKVGDELLFMGKTTSASMMRVNELQVNNEVVQDTCKGDSVGVKLPFIVKPKDKVFLWKTREK